MIVKKCNMLIRLAIVLILICISFKASATKLNIDSLPNHQIIRMKSSGYKVVSDIELKGDTLLLPEGSYLKFNNGKFINGTLEGNNVSLKGNLDKCFKDIYFIGSLKNKNISYKWFAKYKNDTELLRGMLTFLFNNQIHDLTLDLEPNRRYDIYWKKLDYAHAIYEFNKKENKTINGNGAIFNDLRSRSLIGYTSYDGVFLFNNCRNITINDLNYINASEDFNTVIDQNGKIRYKEGFENQIGYIGTSFILLYNDCSDFNIKSRIIGARYGIKSGDYSKYWLCGKYGFKNSILNIDGYKTGYPVAIEVGDNLDISIISENHHRAAYLCGISNSKIKIYAKNIYIAPYHCLLSDSRYSASKDTVAYKGCYNLDVRVTDMGSTVVTNGDSFCIGLQTYRTFLERRNPIIWKNINIKVNKEKEVSNIGLFAMSRRKKEIEDNFPLGIMDLYSDITVEGCDFFPCSQYDLRVLIDQYPIMENISIAIQAPQNNAIITKQAKSKINLRRSKFNEIYEIQR